MAGWYDPFLPTQLDDFVQIRREARKEVSSASCLIIGPWAHARTVTFPSGETPENYRLESLAPDVALFDLHMRPSATAVPKPATISIYVMGGNNRRDHQEAAPV